MSHVTHKVLIEIVPDLRALAATEAVPEVPAALLRLADRYAADDFTTVFTDAQRQAAAA